MKKINIIIYAILGIFLGSACNDEDRLSPTEGVEMTYTLPQGNHDYDARIVDWNKRCGFFILYEFEPKDIYWGQTSWQEAIERDGEWSWGFISDPADQNYAGKQVQFLEDHLFKYYPDSTLQRFMPLKFLLCSKLQYSQPLSSVPIVDIPLFSSIDMIAMNYGNEAIDNMDKHTASLLKDTLNVELLWHAIDVGKLQIDEAFTQLSEYGDYVNNSTMYSLGFINGSSQVASQITDFKYYIQAIVTTPFDVLNAEPEEEDYTYRGILHPSKDVNNMVNRKYNLVINYFKTMYNVDLQKIGNAVM